MEKQTLSPSQADTFAFLRDLRFIRNAAQVIFGILVVLSVGILWTNVMATMRLKRIVPSFEFLTNRAGFTITQKPEWYTPDNTYGEAIIVGLINTLNIVSLGLVFATILGILLGVFLLSNNWLIRTISRVYVEILRNTPLLVQLIFWYYVVMLGLPEVDITVPNEAVMVIPLRLIVYVIAFIGTWVYAAKVPTSPYRLLQGGIIGLILLEVAFALLGSGVAIIIALAVIGAALIAAGIMNSLPQSLSGIGQGIGVMFVVQFVGHLLLDMLFKANVISDPQIIYGEVLPQFYLGRKGFISPEIISTANFFTWFAIILVGIVVAVVLYMFLGRVIDRTGRPIPRTWYALGVILIAAVIGWGIGQSQALPETITVGEGEDAQTVTVQEAVDGNLIEGNDILYYTTTEPVIIRTPELNRFGRVNVGTTLSLNYLALLIGLVVYTSAFIGEIVRAGIQAVPFGQIEAARALGISTGQTLRMIVLPQALRVIIPPMGNQYLNLAKNSSLATFVAYADTYQVGQTTMNQSGQSITGFAVILAIYLSISLVISLVMNFVNSRFQLVTR